MQIDGLVVIGGDGSFRGAQALCDLGVPCIGIPGTIDNDLPYTEMSLGYDTAVNVCVEAIRKIRATSRSHDRPAVVEVMGRHCGDIALHTGIAVGATSIIVPEIEYDLERDVIARIYEQKDTGKKHFIIIVAEGVGGVQDISHYIQHRTGIETRATILGHVQRGGSPSLRDRLMATDMGVAAVHLLAKGIGNRVIASQNGKIVDYDITEALEMPRVFDDRLYKVAMEVSI
jgi:6-phosphofructokinase 1